MNLVKVNNTKKSWHEREQAQVSPDALMISDDIDVDDIDLFYSTSQQYVLSLC